MAAICSKCHQGSPIMSYSEGIPTCIECVWKEQEEADKQKKTESSEERLVGTIFSHLKGER